MALWFADCNFVHKLIHFDFQNLEGHKKKYMDLCFFHMHSSLLCERRNVVPVLVSGGPSVKLADGETFQTLLYRIREE